MSEKSHASALLDDSSALQGRVRLLRHPVPDCPAGRFKRAETQGSFGIQESGRHQAPLIRCAPAVSKVADRESSNSGKLRHHPPKYGAKRFRTVRFHPAKYWSTERGM